MSDKKLNILVLAAAGTGMNVLVQHLIKSGKKLYISDRDFDRGRKRRIRNNLEYLGAVVLKEDETLESLLIDLIIKSPAIENSHPAIVYAEAHNIKVLIRSEYLIDLAKNSDLLGVSGTSGKTTVTSMLAVILFDQHREFSVFCGDEMLNYSSQDKLGNYLHGNSNRLLIELDESDGTLPEYFPTVSCITTINQDHYPLDRLKQFFESFVKNSKKIVINIDSLESLFLLSKYREKIITVSMKDSQADFFIEFINMKHDLLEFLVNGHKGVLKISGVYNILNAGISVAIASQYGISLESALDSLQLFKGVRNRFELRKKGFSNYILDFAHNPEKIEASLKSAQALGLPVNYVYQPHGYGPLKMMTNDFVQMFNKTLRPEDSLFILKIYDSGGTADRSISAEKLVIKLDKDNIFYCNSHDILFSSYQKKKKDNQTWVVAGARDETLRDLRDKMLAS